MARTKEDEIEELKERIERLEALVDKKMYTIARLREDVVKLQDEIAEMHCTWTPPKTEEGGPMVWGG